MLQPRDTVILLAVAHAGAGWTIRSVGEPIGFGTGPVHRALERLGAVGMYDSRRRKVNLAITDEFVRHAARFLLHRELGKPSRGFPTAWGAEPLASRLAATDEPPPVWPAAGGVVRGPSLPPLVDHAASLVDAAPWLVEDLALLDAVAIGDARTRVLAADLLMERLDALVTAA